MLNFGKTLVLAPSSSGKSWAAATYPDTFVDGDVVVWAAGGWPENTDWQDHEGGDVVRAKTVDIVLAYMRSHGDRLVLFNTCPQIVKEKLHKGEAVVVWLPAIKKSMCSFQCRRAAEPHRWPYSFADVLENRRVLRAAARRYNWRVVESIRDLTAEGNANV